MATIDKAALIEAAAEALEGAYARWSDLVEVGEPVIESEHEAMAAAVVSVVVAAVLKPLLELHRSEFRSECRLYFCVSCGVAEPCPTVLLLDQIEADVKGGER